MYQSLVRSHLDYCDTIYHMPALNNQINLVATLTSLMETVERTQYQAALAVTGAWQGSNRSKLYEELGWESITDRRWCRRILQIHNIKKVWLYKGVAFFTLSIPKWRPVTRDQLMQT